jgi:hypothetical protein
MKTKNGKCRATKHNHQEMAAKAVLCQEKKRAVGCGAALCAKKSENT